MDRNLLPPGVELINEEYVAECRQLRSRTDLTPSQREILRRELSDEHRDRCSTEWKIVVAQQRYDRDTLGKSNT